MLADKQRLGRAARADIGGRLRGLLPAHATACHGRSGRGYRGGVVHRGPVARALQRGFTPAGLCSVARLVSCVFRPSGSPTPAQGCIFNSASSTSTGPLPRGEGAHGDPS
jgi:hypothetical protein